MLGKSEVEFERTKQTFSGSTTEILSSSQIIFIVFHMTYHKLGLLRLRVRVQLKYSRQIMMSCISAQECMCQIN